MWSSECFIINMMFFLEQMKNELNAVLGETKVAFACNVMVNVMVIFWLETLTLSLIFSSSFFFFSHLCKIWSKMKRRNLSTIYSLKMNMYIGILWKCNFQVFFFFFLSSCITHFICLTKILFVIDYVEKVYSSLYELHVCFFL